jgi:hypothetical protein
MLELLMEFMTQNTSVAPDDVVLWIKAVLILAFVSIARINETLGLQERHILWNQEGQSQVNAEDILVYHTYVYKERKVSCGDRPCNLYNSQETSTACAKTHLDAWIGLKDRRGCSRGPDAFIFPSVSKLYSAKDSVPRRNANGVVISGLESASIDWGSSDKCTDQTVITILNALIVCLLSHACQQMIQNDFCLRTDG